MSKRYKVYGDIFDSFDWIIRRLEKKIHGPFKVGDEVMLVSSRIDIKDNVFYFWNEEGSDQFTYRILKIHRNNTADAKALFGLEQWIDLDRCYPIGSPCRGR